MSVHLTATATLTGDGKTGKGKLHISVEVFTPPAFNKDRSFTKHLEEDTFDVVAETAGPNKGSIVCAANRKLEALGLYVQAWGLGSQEAYAALSTPLDGWSRPTFAEVEAGKFTMTTALALEPVNMA